MAAESESGGRRVRGGKVESHCNENHLGWLMRSKETITGVIVCCLVN